MNRKSPNPKRHIPNNNQNFNDLNSDELDVGMTMIRAKPWIVAKELKRELNLK